MSRITRAAELAKQVLGTNRNVRNQQIMGRDIPGRTGGLTAPSIALGRNIPGSYKNIAETVLRTPSPRPGSITSAARAVGRSDAAGMGAGALLAGGGVMMLSQTDPNDLGRQLAQIDKPFYELIGKVQESASDLAEIPQVYFMQVKQAYDDEIQKQQELQNIQEFGDPMGAPVEVPPSIEDQAIKPVSVFMAGGGSADLSDNEPRMEDRSPANQMFSIESEISNLMKSYNMLVEAQEFDRAQQVATMIDQLQQQKIGVQAQRDPMVNPMTQSQKEYLGEYGKTLSNIDTEDISRILDSISI